VSADQQPAAGRRWLTPVIYGVLGLELAVVIVFAATYNALDFRIYMWGGHAVLHNDRDFVDVRGIVAVTGGNGAGEHEAVTVLMLQPFAGEHDAGIPNSSLYLPIAASNSVLGRTPASVFLSALSKTMNRIARSLPDARQ